MELLLSKEVETFASQYKNSGEDYVVGPKAMIRSVVDILKSNEIKGQKIKKDIFIGY